LFHSFCPGCRIVPQPFALLLLDRPVSVLASGPWDSLLLLSRLNGFLPVRFLTFALLILQRPFRSHLFSGLTFPGQAGGIRYASSSSTVFSFVLPSYSSRADLYVPSLPTELGAPHRLSQISWRIQCPASFRGFIRVFFSLFFRLIDMYGPGIQLVSFYPFGLELFLYFFNLVVFFFRLFFLVFAWIRPLRWLPLRCRLRKRI